KMNFIPAQLARESNDRIVLSDGTSLVLPAGRVASTTTPGNVFLGLRPEHISRATGDTAEPGVTRLDATVDLLQPTGSRTFATFNIGGVPVIAELQAHDVSRAGEKIALMLNLNRASLFAADSEKAI